MDPKRIKELAGIREATDDDLSPEEQAKIDAADARYERETKVRVHVQKTFEEMGFEIKHVYYDEADQAVDVDIEVYGTLPLEKLAQVLRLGFGTDYSVYPYNGYIEVRFTWNAVLD